MGICQTDTFSHFQISHHYIEINNKEVLGKRREREKKARNKQQSVMTLNRTNALRELLFPRKVYLMR